MGKGKKTNVVAAIQKCHRTGESAVDPKKGCNCPIGCVIGEIIPAGAHKLPDGAVKTVCSNENCPAVPYQHGECFEKWEEFLADGVKRQQGCYRQQTKAAIQRELWDRRMAPLIVKLSTCPTCHGHIRRAVQDERAERVWRHAAEVARNPQPPAGAQRNNRNRAVGGGATAGPPPQAAKRQPTTNKAPTRANTSGRPKVVASSETPLQHPITSTSIPTWPPIINGAPPIAPNGLPIAWPPIFNIPPPVITTLPPLITTKGTSTLTPTTWTPPRSANESSYTPPRPPVDVERWQCTQQPQQKKSPIRVDTNDLQEFPTLRDDVWEPVPRALAAELRAAETASSSSIAEIQKSPTWISPAFDPNNLTGAQLISELEDAVKAFSELYISHDIVRDLLDRLDVRVMEEIANLGGLEQWLCDRSSTLVVRKNRIVLKSESVPPQMKSFGNVTRILNQAGDTGIIYAEAYDTKVFFDVTDCDTEGCTNFLEDDIVSFKAEKMVESTWHGCKWQAVFLELIQRDASVAARAEPMDKTEGCWSPSAVASPTDVKCKEESGESSPSIEQYSAGPIPLDMAGITARTSYLQMRLVANTTNIRSPAVVSGGFRRIPMATVTPDDFHPSTTANSPPPLQTSSPLLHHIGHLPVTCRTLQSAYNKPSSYETLLAFTDERSEKTTVSVTESTPSIDELSTTTTVMGDFGLGAWLTLDKSVDDCRNYAVCSKEIKELVNLFS